jgi:hypothetical protein
LSEVSAQAGSKRPGLFGTHPTLTLACCVVLPMLAISILGRIFASLIRPRIPKATDLTNLGALRHIPHLFKWGGNDSWLPMQRAVEVLHGPNANALYEKLFFGEHVRFQYPLTSLIPFGALAKIGISSIFSLNALNLAIFLLNVAAVAALAWLLFPSGLSQSRSATDGHTRARTGVAFVAAIAAVVFYPVIRAGVLGQIQLWIDLLFCCALICWTLGWRLIAGLIIGVAATIKPQLGLLLLWGLLWNEWRFVSGIVVGFLPLAALAAAFYGLHNNIMYFDVLSFLARHGESYYANNSINGILNWYFTNNDSLKWYGDDFTPYVPLVHFGTLITSVVFVLIVIVPPLFRRGRGASLTDLGAAAICTVVSSPVAWEHHYGIILPLYLVGLRYFLTAKPQSKTPLLLGLIFVSWVLVSNFIPFALLLAHTPFAIAQAYCFFGAVLLLGLLLIAPEFASERDVG